MLGPSSGGGGGDSTGGGGGAPGSPLPIGVGGDEVLLGPVVGGGGCPGCPPEPNVLQPVDEDLVAGPSASGAGGGGTDVLHTGKRTKDPPDPGVPGLEGSRVTFKDYDPKKQQGTTYPNFHLHCPLHGGTCGKTRGRKFVKLRGQLEPLAYLHAWIHSSQEGKSHPQTNPTDEQVIAYHDDHRQELQQVWDRIPNLTGCCKTTHIYIYITHLPRSEWYLSAHKGRGDVPFWI